MLKTIISTAVLVGKVFFFFTFPTSLHPVPSESVSSLHTLSLSAFPWMYLLYSLILSAQLRSGCLTVFFSLRRAFANQLETCTDASCYRAALASLSLSTSRQPCCHFILPSMLSCTSPPSLTCTRVICEPRASRTFSVLVG